MNRLKSISIKNWIIIVACVALSGLNIVLLFSPNYLFGLLSLIFILSILGVRYSIYLDDCNKIDNYFRELVSLLGSLRLETSLSPFTQKKRYRSLNELEGLIDEIGLSVRKKTNQLRDRNKELKRNQNEVLKQNNELSKAYNELSKSRERYNKLVKSLEEEFFMYGISPDGEVVYISESVEGILGYTTEEFKKRRSTYLTNNPINKIARKVMEEIKMGRPQPKFLLEVFHKDCSPRMLEISELPVSNKGKSTAAIEGIAHDITTRYNADERIREQEEKYRRVFNSASDFIFLFNLEKDNTAGNFIEANTYTQRYLGYTQKELQQMTPDSLNAAEIWNELHDRDKNDVYERIWETKDGTVINVEISEHVFNMKGNRVCIAVARDITERKRVVEEIKFMNEELVNQKENLEALLDNLTQTQEQLVQSEKMAALGQLIAGVAHEINTPLGAIKASVGNLGDSLESAVAELPALFQNQSRDNLELFLNVFESQKKKKSELTSREKREYKRNIRKELTAKEIKDSDLIADLLVYLEVYEDYNDFIDLLSQPDALRVLRNARDFISLRKNTRTISIATDKASKVVFALKKYAHRDSMDEKVPTDINDGIETVLTLYDNQLKQGLELKKNFGELPLAMCYQDEINQVWTNLIQNAIQAMGTTGILTINTRFEDNTVSVDIIDTGEGIEPTIMEKIFEPFFTTKKQGEGSGLGLDIVKKIIDKHSGNIEIKTEIGKGTAFLITLPLI